MRVKAKGVWVCVGDIEQGAKGVKLIRPLNKGAVDGESHKRLLILATISALAPAWLRFRHFLPAGPNPFVAFSVLADSLVAVVIARDWFVSKRVHPTYLWAGGAMILVHIIELLAIRSEPWLRLSRWLLS